MELLPYIWKVQPCFYFYLFIYLLFFSFLLSDKGFDALVLLFLPYTKLFSRVT